MNLPKLTYSEAGVDIDASNEAKRRIGQLVARTFKREGLKNIGSFGALFPFPQNRYREPVLVSSCDGVGTKLKIAFMAGIHNTVGYDLVSHCVSDILVQGARPLFFLDYISCGKMNPNVVEQLVSGMVDACEETGCALVGGETAEMPEFYSEGEYDVAGFIVGVVEKSEIINGSRIQPGDLLLGLPSLGLHTNGFSLARRLFFDRLGCKVRDEVPELQATVADILLAPHRNYYPLIEPLLDRSALKGMAHITGGGITENVPRILPPGTAARISKGSWPVLAVFEYIREKGKVDEAEMLRTFNMGIGMVLCVAPGDADSVRQHFGRQGEACHLLGEVIEGEPSVNYVA